MNRLPVRPALALAVAGLLAVFATACGSSGDSAPADAKQVSIKLTDAGCDPRSLSVPAGPISFEIENDGSSKVTEMEVLKGETILGEEENLTQGMTGSFSLTLEEGEYTLHCNNGEQEDGTLTVSGKLEGEGSPAVGGADEREAGGVGASRRGNP